MSNSVSATLQTFLPGLFEAIGGWSSPSAFRTAPSSIEQARVFPAIPPPRPHPPAMCSKFSARALDPRGEHRAGARFQRRRPGIEPCQRHRRRPIRDRPLGRAGRRGPMANQYPASFYFSRRKSCRCCVRERSQQPNRCYTHRNRLSDDCTLPRTKTVPTF